MRIHHLAASVLCFASSNVLATQDPPPVYAEKFTIERQVDANRYVQKAVMTNTVDDDYILEFTAHRGDGTRERWTITYQTNASRDYFQQVSVNGEWHYSLSYVHNGASPLMTLSVPSLSAELNVLGACGDSDLALFKAIAVQTDADRSVVSEVLEAMAEEAPPGHPDCHIDCLHQWLDPFCPPADPTNWGQVNACCVASKYYRYCLDICWCNADPDEECLQTAFKNLMAALQGCFEEGIDGVQALAACP